MSKESTMIDTNL